MGYFPDFETMTTEQYEAWVKADEAKRDLMENYVFNYFQGVDDDDGDEMTEWAMGLKEYWEQEGVQDDSEYTPDWYASLDFPGVNEDASDPYADINSFCEYLKSLGMTFDPTYGLDGPVDDELIEGE